MRPDQVLREGGEREGRAGREGGCGPGREAGAAPRDRGSGGPWSEDSPSCSGGASRSIWRAATRTSPRSSRAASGSSTCTGSTWTRPSPWPDLLRFLKDIGPLSVLATIDMSALYSNIQREDWVEAVRKALEFRRLSELLLKIFKCQHCSCSHNLTCGSY